MRPINIREYGLYLERTMISTAPCLKTEYDKNPEKPIDQLVENIFETFKERVTKDYAERQELMLNPDGYKEKLELYLSLAEDYFKRAGEALRRQIAELQREAAPPNPSQKA